MEVKIKENGIKICLHGGKNVWQWFVLRKWRKRFLRRKPFKHIFNLLSATNYHYSCPWLLILMKTSRLRRLPDYVAEMNFSQRQAEARSHSTFLFREVPFTGSSISSRASKVVSWEINSNRKGKAQEFKGFFYEIRRVTWGRQTRIIAGVGAKGTLLFIRLQIQAK